MFNQANLFASAMRDYSNYTATENGQICYNDTGDALLNLFSTIGSLRSRSEIEITYLFERAYSEDPLNAIRIVFYARDIRNGCGERRTFRIIVKYAANVHPEAIIPNIRLFENYGRFDDLYALVGTKCEDSMWKYMKSVFEMDVAMMQQNKPISLLAKWIKTPDASSIETRRLGKLTAKKLNYSVYAFKRILRKMRKYIDVTETKMSSNMWSDINYEATPSRASMLYKNAFIKHDGDRYNEYIKAVAEGKKKINASTLYPYDIIEKYNIESMFRWGKLDDSDVSVDPTLEELWKALPNYVEEGTNAIVIADVSGSMEGRPMNSSVGLALYFAERNTGPYKDLCMVFSETAKVVNLKGRSIPEKIAGMYEDIWYSSTNLRAAFDTILDIAVDNKIPNDQMPKALIVISDMEIDDGCNNMLFHREMTAKYERFGYTMPTIIYWNVDSRHDTFHASKDTLNTVLVSGQSVTTFRNVIDAIGSTPYEMMMKIINKYADVTIASNE